MRVRSSQRSRGRMIEIDGLRAVALSLVVVFHLFGNGRVSGGVDVFLFVSGLVLTLSLIRAVERKEQGNVLSRWGRTFGRLAPPAAVVLIAVVVMSLLVLPPWNRVQNLREVVSAALYVENWQLIASQLAYGAAGPLTSPVQHFWSLSIQGQLFVAVPLVVALVYASRRIIRRPGTMLWVLVTVVTLASFGYAAWSNSVDPAVAYFDTFARAWEFGAGILTAWLLHRGLDTWLPAPTTTGWVGLGVIIASGFVIDGASMYPGPAALVPVIGAFAVVMSTRARRKFAASAALRSRPLRELSRISYPLYLWHWPVLILFLSVTNNAEGRIDWRGAVAVLSISVALAYATWLLLERPVQRALPRLTAPALGAAVVFSIAVAPGIAFGAGVWSQSTVQRVEAGDCIGAAAVDPLRTDCAGEPVNDEVLLPAVDQLSADDDNRGQCWAGTSSEDFNMCALGPDDYSARLLAVGDSHNNTLIGVYEEIAVAHGWRIDVAGRAACHWSDTPRVQQNAALERRCEEWNDHVDDYVKQTDLDAIIVTNSSRARYDVDDAARTEGFLAAWSQRRDPTTPVIAIRDNPIFGREAIECVLDSAAVAAGECSLPRDDAVREDGLADATAADAYAHLVDLNDFMCDEMKCKMVVGGVITTRDGAHLTATYAHTLTPYLDRRVSEIVG